ncbi:Translation initiation factor 2 [Candidatus Arthromitus sp. SFB-mouse-NL]|uniref:translation initiation factor IF-2 n=1 Tax=Candidatus Arthromitus sp. SFB-mouse-NL TaxID=1508644 RepID=UPI00049B4A1B|nr:translation initiation factor IF-2 [Candidatus Arthromitus sp. SFB-mouse-NL]AID44686.1 Translation initiation factor 2 [Candidatus Arthromitus sp. SFB-mouse-NL]
MSKVRIYELAKAVNKPSKELISILKNEFDVDVKNHMSVLSDKDSELIKEYFEIKDKDSVSENEMSMDYDKYQENVNRNDIVQEYEEIMIEQIDKQSSKNKNKNKNNRRQSSLKHKKNNVAANDSGENNGIIEISRTISVKDLAQKLNKSTADVIKNLMFLGLMVSINQEIDFEVAKKLCDKYEVECVKKEETSNDDKYELIGNLTETKSENLSKRPPIITVMGHVDHGKTSLLDCIRKTNVSQKEAGGITQHIGAYKVQVGDEIITFIDTPGHEAFTQMRARGAKVTDIVILVVAADDGIMPQTVEAINHCKSANVPIIVAVNKIDKPEANIDKVKQELTEYEIIAEDWGGSTVFVNVSAKTGEGIDELLEMIILTADIQELTADKSSPAKGTVIESRLDKGRGPLATLLVQDGTLKIGDCVVVGNTYGKIRAMYDENDVPMKEAGPSIPVLVLGLNEVPDAGDRFESIKDEKVARQISNDRKQQIKDSQMNNSKISLETVYSQIKDGTIKELSIIVKSDVQGSSEALKQSLEKLSSENIKVKVIHSAVGAINESDIIFASTSNAIIIGFNVRPDNNALLLADKEKVDIRTYRLIYEALDDIKSAMIGLLDPDIKEVYLGRVEIRQLYKISNVGTVAGCYVLDGKLTRNCNVRILRQGVVIFESKLSSLKRFKDDVKEVNKGYECGLSIENFNDLKEEDIIEGFEMKEFKRNNL